MPKPFLNKLIVHGAIGFFCVLFGCIYGFITDDQIFLLMSLCIGVGTAIRIVSLLHTIKMHDYTELTGTCTKREVSPLTKKQKIIFRSTDQKEYHFTYLNFSFLYRSILYSLDIHLHTYPLKF